MPASRTTSSDWIAGALRLEAQGEIPPGNGPGDRFCASAHYQQAAGLAGSPPGGDLFRVRVASVAEMVAFLADAGDTTRPEVDTPAATSPTRSIVPGLVELVEVPAGVDLRRLAETSRTLSGAAALPGSPLPKARVVIDSSALTMRPWGPYFEIETMVFEDEAVARPMIDRLITELFWRFLEVDILAGDGSSGAGTYELAGILTTLGIGDHAGTDNLVADLAEGCAQVGEAGHYGPLTAVLHPRTLAVELFGDAAAQVADALPMIERYVPSTTIPEGDALVGDFPGSARLFVSEAGLAIQARPRPLDGLWWVRPTAEVAFDVHQPAGFCHITAPES